MKRALVGLVIFVSSSAFGSERVPVVVELFTSEGCSSCPSADDALAELEAKQPVDGVELIPLGFHVDYWNQLGWEDRFSSAAFTERQARYTRAFAEESVYTPQMVVNGEKGFVGSAQRAVAVANAAKSQALIPVTVGLVTPATSKNVTVRVQAPGAPEGSELWLFVTESGLSSKVTRGENAGRTLRHAAVVRSATRIRDAAAKDFTLPVDPRWDATKLKVVAVLQHATSRRILGAASAALRTPAAE